MVFSIAFSLISLVGFNCFFFPGWPIYIGLAVMEFPDLKNKSKQIKSRSEQMY